MITNKYMVLYAMCIVLPPRDLQRQQGKLLKARAVFHSKRANT